MNTRHFAVSFAAFVLAACSQISQMENPTEDEVPIYLTYSTLATAETKASQNLNEGTFASGETIAVRISNTEDYDWSYYTFKTGDDGALNPDGSVPYYPAGSQNIDIVAYYPAWAGGNENDEDEHMPIFTIATDQTGEGSYKASDLMVAVVTNQAKQANPVNLVFSHQMAKICVNITAGDGVSGINSVSILNVKPSVHFWWDLGSVEVGLLLDDDFEGAKNDPTSIAVSNHGAAVIPAQSIEGDLLSIVTPEGTATYSVPFMSFDAGHLYTINIPVNWRAINTTTEIIGWGSEGTLTVDTHTEEDPYTLTAIDMGSGLKWANMNVGAFSVTDYGDYFAWGETRPYYVNHDAYGNSLTTGHWIDGKTGYNWANYSLCNGTGSTMNKYCGADNKTQLELVDDAAHANWGGNWRIPTRDEWGWLYSNCTMVWINDYNNTGVQGFLLTSNINGHTLFLPAAGCWVDDSHSFGYFGNNSNLAPFGYYQASTCHSSFDKSYHRFFHRDDDELVDSYHYRFLGLSVRAVFDSHLNQ